MGQTNSSSSPSSSLVVRRPKGDSPSSTPHAIFSIPLIVHLILTFTPPTTYSPLLVSTSWYQTFIPILYHTVTLRSQPDIHNLFLASPSGPHPNLRREALYHVRRLVLLVGESPAASPPKKELERWAKGAREGENWLPRLEVVQLGYDRQGLRDLGSGLIGMVDGRGHSLAGEVGRLFRVIRPREILFRPTMWGENQDDPEMQPRTEMHAILHPSTLTRLANLLGILYDHPDPPRTVSYSHLFPHQLSLHAMQTPRPPTPTFLLPDTMPPSAPTHVRLAFAPLSSLPTEGEQGLSLNPWDRRVAIVRQACRDVGAGGEVSVRGVGRSLREELRVEALRKAEGVEFGRLVFEEEEGETRRVGRDEDEKREVPDLTPSQLHALFYRAPIVGFWPGSSLTIPVTLSAS